VDRGREVRTQVVRDVSAKTLRPIIEGNVNKASTLMTDEALVYEKIGEAFVAHGTVNHSANEYARAEWFHTNSAENYFSILKRGVNGVYHHVSEQHLHRYCGEFDFRYNNRKITDAERMHKSVGGIVGKRLTYRRPDKAKEA
jgi:transposase-like protein